MYYSIIADKDATIYERSESLNSGIDEILEIQKVVSASTTNDIYNSRILIKFNLTSISKSVSRGTITNPTYSLDLYTVQAKDLAYNYGLEVYPISQSWDMGKGRTHTRKTSPGGSLIYEKEGVSWKYRDGEQYFGNVWSTASLGIGGQSSGSTGSYATIGGGGTWYTGSRYRGSRTYNYEQTDLSINVTSIVENWLTGSHVGSSIPNEGFIILRSGSNQPGYVDEEKNAKPYGTIQFFSKETHTVYQPKLTVKWDDSSFNTGGLSALDIATDNIIYVKNNRGKYKKNSRERFRIVGREKYPTKTYATKSAELTIKYLPSSSYYAVKDSVTNEIIIPFNTGSTKISCDSQGNYLDLWMDQFYAERRYAFLFKVISGSLESPTIERIYDADNSFKVVR
jgi:hypothetical protein